MIKISKQNIYIFGVVCFVLFCTIIAIISMRHLPGGISLLTNSSNSMVPKISEGDITFVKQHETYKENDIISFYLQTKEQEPALIVTHRVYTVGGNVYVTKGDHNEAIDEYPVLPRNIIGKVVFIIPKAGYILIFVKSFIGTMLCIIFPASCIIAYEAKTIAKLYIHKLP